MPTKTNKKKKKKRRKPITQLQTAVRKKQGYQFLQHDKEFFLSSSPNSCSVNSRLGAVQFWFLVAQGKQFPVECNGESAVVLKSQILCGGEEYNEIVAGGVDSSVQTLLTLPAEGTGEIGPVMEL